MRIASFALLFSKSQGHPGWPGGGGEEEEADGVPGQPAGRVSEREKKRITVFFLKYLSTRVFCLENRLQ